MYSYVHTLNEAMPLRVICSPQDIDYLTKTILLGIRNFFFKLLVGESNRLTNNIGYLFSLVASQELNVSCCC